MKMKQSRNKEIIKTIKSGRFYTECPNCSEEIALHKADLFDNDNFSEEALRIYEEQLDNIRLRKEHLKKIREIGTARSEIGAFSTNIGLILERIAPALEKFRFNHNDCRSIFDPIDYIIFEGLTKKGTVDKIFFVDIKTGNARLSSRQKEIRSLIFKQKVSLKIF